MTHSCLTWVSSHVPRAGQGRVFTPTLHRESETEKEWGGEEGEGGERGRIGKRLHLGRFYRTNILFLLSRLPRAEHVDFRVGHTAVRGMRVRVK